MGDSCGRSVEDERRSHINGMFFSLVLFGVQTVVRAYVDGRLRFGWGHVRQVTRGHKRVVQCLVTRMRSRQWGWNRSHLINGSLIYGRDEGETKGDGSKGGGGGDGGGGGGGLGGARNYGGGHGGGGYGGGGRHVGGDGDDEGDNGSRAEGCGGGSEGGDGVGRV
ncbi:glycine-rich RNA-binding protein 1-like [Daucus carota subsp. sativus]|uniref:glycine-rich RNA-binding protein 1-like n=1 Tax=Daucus carota subsp. sativus TaxID=79200 RepID=UPI0007EF4490|nr:PREDICTED: glycine-rich RNA-binding protein 1-like [Daucus carota subsp. sativus]